MSTHIAFPNSVVSSHTTIRMESGSEDIKNNRFSHLSCHSRFNSEVDQLQSSSLHYTATVVRAPATVSGVCEDIMVDLREGSPLQHVGGIGGNSQHSSCHPRSLNDSRVSTFVGTNGGSGGDTNRFGSFNNIRHRPRDESSSVHSSKNKASVNASLKGQTHSDSVPHLSRNFHQHQVNGETPCVGDQKPRPCSVQLRRVFGCQISIIIASFIAMTVVSLTTANTIATNLIEEGLHNSLHYAGTEIDGPITEIEVLLSEYRERFVAFWNIHERETCSDVDYTLSGSATFYSDSVLAIQSHSSMNAMFLAKRRMPVNSTNRITSMTPFRDYADEVSLCSSTSRTIYRRFRINSPSILASPQLTNADFYMNESARLPTVAEYKDLNSIPKTPRRRTNAAVVSTPTGSNGDINSTAEEEEEGGPYDFVGHEGRHVSVVLSTPMFTWIPYVIIDGFGNRHLSLVGTAPLSYNIFNSSSNSTHFMMHMQTNIETFQVGVEGISTIEVVSSLGIVYNMMNFTLVLQSITPANAESHTSLYHVGNVLLSSSSLRSDALVDESAQLYPAGKSPYTGLNIAYNRCDFLSKSVGDIDVYLGGEGSYNVVSCYLFETPVSHIHFGVVQATPRSHYFSPITHLRTVMTALSVCCAILILVICITIGVLIRIGVTQLLANMELASAMKNDRTTFITSFLFEIEQLAKGFGRMNERLMEARAYLPQHMLITSDESGAEDINDEDNEEASNGDRGADHQSSGSKTSASHDQGTDATVGTLLSSHNDHTGTKKSHHRQHQKMSSSNNTGSNNGEVVGRIGSPIVKPISNPHRNAAAGQYAQMSGGLVVKRVTILSVNIRAFHRIVNVFAPSSVKIPTTILTECVSAAAHRNKGVIDSFHGDHFLVSFNAARANAEGSLKASQCALDLASAVAASFESRDSRCGEENNNHRHLCAMGISSGKACVGHLGTNSLKRLSIIGPVYSRAIALERICKRFNVTRNAIQNRHANSQQQNCHTTVLLPHHVSETDCEQDEGHILPLPPIQCLTDSSVANEIQHRFVLQVLGGVCGSPFSAPSFSPLFGAPSDCLIADGAAPFNEDCPSPMHPFNDNHEKKKIPNSEQSAIANNVSSQTTAEVLYALRARQSDSDVGGGDEWLYEMQQNNQPNTTLCRLNAIVQTYVKQCLLEKSPIFLEHSSTALNELKDNLKLILIESASTHNTKKNKEHHLQQDSAIYDSIAIDSLRYAECIAFGEETPLIGDDSVLLRRTAPVAIYTA